MSKPKYVSERVHEDKVAETLTRKDLDGYKMISMNKAGRYYTGRDLSNGTGKYALFYTLTFELKERTQ